jgi:hypothetical protein
MGPVGITAEPCVDTQALSPAYDTLIPGVSVRPGQRKPKRVKIYSGGAETDPKQRSTKA